jgi:ribose transport system permease protein
MGLCAAVAGIILSSRSGQYAPDIAGGLFIPPYVAAFFGMSVLAVGVFNIFGTVVGALFIATLQTGLVVQGVQDWVANVIVGSVLLLILFIAAQTREQKG